MGFCDEYPFSSYISRTILVFYILKNIFEKPKHNATDFKVVCSTFQYETLVVVWVVIRDVIFYISFFLLCVDGSLSFKMQDKWYQRAFVLLLLFDDILQTCTYSHPHSCVLTILHCCEIDLMRVDVSRGFLINC